MAALLCGPYSFDRRCRPSAPVKIYFSAGRRNRRRRRLGDCSGLSEDRKWNTCWAGTRRRSIAFPGPSWPIRLYACFLDVFISRYAASRTTAPIRREGADAIAAAAQIVTAVQSIVIWNIAATDSCVITIGKFLLQERREHYRGPTELTGTIRTTSSETRYRAMQRLKRRRRVWQRRWAHRLPFSFVSRYIAPQKK